MRTRGQPDMPPFVARLRATVDAAGQRNASRVWWQHSYRSRSGPRWVVDGWSSAVQRISEPGRSLEIWFDNLDNDVTVSGLRFYEEWSAERLVSEEGRSECLAAVERLVEDFAAGRLGPRRPRWIERVRRIRC
jgi:hypothetical protein